MKLNRKHMHFIDAYMATNNAAEAARQAGYSEGNAKQQGSRLLKDPDIQAEIERRASERSDKYKMTADRVLEELVDTLEVLKAEVKPKRNSKTGKPLTNEDGNPVYTRDNNGIMKCLELIGKIRGVDAFKESVDMEIGGRDQKLIEALQSSRDAARRREVEKEEESFKIDVHGRSDVSKYH